MEVAFNRLSQKKERKLEKGRIRPKARLTVSEALVLWHESRRGAVAQGTYVNDHHYTARFEREFGSWLMGKMEKEHIQRFLTELPVSHTVKNCTKSSLNLLFCFCEDEGIIGESPMYRVRLPRHKETLAEQRKREDKGFSLDEVRQLIGAIGLKTRCASGS